MIIPHKFPQCQRQPGILGKGANPVEKPGADAKGRAEIVQNNLGGLFLQLDVAALGHGKKTVLYFIGQIVVGTGQKGGKLFLEIVFAVGLPDEVQNRQAFLLLAKAQTTAQLLQKDGQRFRGP